MLLDEQGRLNYELTSRSVLCYKLIMEKVILNYRVIIEPHKEKGKKVIYLAECPALGVYDWADSIEEVLESIRKGIQIHIANLIEAKEEIPISNIQQEILTTTQVEVPRDVRFAFA